MHHLSLKKHKPRTSSISQKQRDPTPPRKRKSNGSTYTKKKKKPFAEASNRSHAFDFVRFSYVFEVSLGSCFSSIPRSCLFFLSSSVKRKRRLPISERNVPPTHLSRRNEKKEMQHVERKGKMLSYRSSIFLRWTSDSLDVQKNHSCDTSRLP